MEWLRKPAELPRIRDELALKTILGVFAPEDALLHNLRLAVIAHQQRKAALQQELLEHGNPSEPGSWQQIALSNRRDPYIGLVAQLGVNFEEMYLHWLHESIALLEASRKMK